MISEVWLAAVVAVALSPSLARADAYAWGGDVGRVSVHVSISGFNEGAGGEGWSLESARWFVSWAHRLEEMLPAGTHAEVGNDGPDEAIVLRLVTGASVVTRDTGLTRAFPGELDPVLASVGAALGVPVPVASPVPLFTIQLFAARDSARASRFASERGRLAVNALFYEQCLPCGLPAAHVLDEGALHRVVVGLYPDRAHARRDLRRLGVPGAFVRRL